MNKTAIKNYATGARRKLMEAVAQKMFLYGFGENKNDTDAEAEKTLAGSGVFLDERQKVAWRNLSWRIQNHGYKNVVEEVAYTWFNRLIALRFMEVNGYLPSGVRVLSSESGGRLEPDCVREWERLDYIKHDEAAKRKVQSDETLYRYILISQCNALGKILPRMFSAISDYAELLLPDRLYIKDGVVYDLTNAIEPDDFRDQVEIIGWLYQYYISEKKDEVFAALKKNVKITKENIPAATQLFTPDWIVKYMVENSLGRLWLESHPDDALKANWKYYLDEAEQTPEVNERLAALRAQNPVNKPEDIKFIDPCMGSGHILVYAFDVLMQIYESVGYTTRDAVRLIVEKNIYGLDIDDRAHQLAYFAVMMKARQYDRRFFTRGVTPNVYAIIDGNELGGEYRHEMGDFLLYEEHRNNLNYLLKAFGDAKEYGSIIKLEQRDYEGLLEAWLTTGAPTAGNINLILWFAAVEKAVPDLVRQAILLTQKYDVVVTNPPYMGGSGQNAKLVNYLKESYPNTKSDTFSAFIEQCSRICKPMGYIGMFTPYVWMFIQSYEKLRNMIYSNQTISSLIQFEYSAFEEATVPVCTFVLLNSHTSSKGVYLRLVDFRGGMEVQRQKTLEAIANHSCRYYYIADSSNFIKMHGSPVAYWISEGAIRTYDSCAHLGDLEEVRGGLTTGDNSRFLRMWFEVACSKISLSTTAIEHTESSGATWFPLAKGGEFRKWYGNLEYIVNWKNNGAEIKHWVTHNPKDPNTKHWSRRLFNIECYFKKIITWSGISSGKPSMRYCDKSIFGSGAKALLPTKNYNYYLGFLNSNVALMYLQAVSPTLNYETGHISSLPITVNSNASIDTLVEQNIAISRADWDSFETSWDFKRHPLIAFKGMYYLSWENEGKVFAREEIGSVPWKYSMKLSYQDWEAACENRFATLKSNEETLNRIFIDIYGLQDELTPEVEDKDVTVRRADLGREIRSFVSYAVGCMFGRYSLDEEGLILAGQQFNERFVYGTAPVAGTGLTGRRSLTRVMTDCYLRKTDGTLKITSFIPESDNILPITDNDYFEDDIVGRFVEFVKVVYGADTLTANLDFIADALYPDGKGTARERIRRYFLNDFYKDHVKIYQKRPIYWQFDSGKQNGFKALVYLHRYNRFTVAQVRTEYLHPLQRKYEAEVERLNALSMLDETTPREKAEYKKQTEKFAKQIAECRAYDPIIAHIALQNIELDLDDGVTVNYAKFQNVEVASGDGRPPVNKDLLTKI